MGSRRRQVLGIHSDDAVLAWVGAIGLGLVAGTALIVDLRSNTLLGGRTLAQLMVDGPRLSELSPGRRGVATIASGNIDTDELEKAIEILSGRWPAIVVRSDGRTWKGPTVPYRPIYPGFLGVRQPTPSVWQPATGSVVGSLPGPVLPGLGRRSVVAMLKGQQPKARRWVGAWHEVWEMPWV